MNKDFDIKIAGDKPSKDIKRNIEKSLLENGPDKIAVKKAKEWGKLVALKFIEDAQSTANAEANHELLIQRRMLLSFTATIGFEQLCGDDILSGIAQKSFIDNIKAESKAIYDTSGDTGAFSFYYLAFRRGNEIERRIGQTFAMLCSHDGDPIFQELGEALYCWFLSVVKNSAKQCEII